VKLLLYAYPGWWRRRYGDELLALLDSEPVTWRGRVNVLSAGLGERFGGSGRPQLRVLWAWAYFVVGGMAFQKTSEHWQVVVPGGDRGIPTASFDTVVVAAVIGSAAVLSAVALALPAFFRDLRDTGWAELRWPLLAAAAGTAIAAASLGAVALDHDIVAGSIFVSSAFFSLFAWTSAAARAARRLPIRRAHSHLAVLVGASMVVMTVAAAVWFAAVTPRAPDFVGAAQLTVIAVFMLTALALAGSAVGALRARAS
jgi:hypothetical protein